MDGTEVDLTLIQTHKNSIMKRTIPVYVLQPSGATRDLC